MTFQTFDSGRRTVSVLMVLLLLVGAFFIYAKKDTRFSVAGAGNFLSPQTSLSANASPKETIDFVGDVLFARYVETIQNTYGIDYVFAGMPPVASTSYLVGNFENPVPKVHVPTPVQTMSFSAPSSSVPALSTFGFTHMGLANNHSYDKGPDNFLNTQKVLQENKLIPFGDQRLGSSTVTYVDIAGGSVALLGVYALGEMPDRGELQKLLQASSEKSDYQVVYVHWGTEYQLVHSAFQERLARTLIDLGADVIVGHHPHVVQDIEQYKGKTIFYSLGNFIFDQYFSRDVQESLYISMRIENEGLTFALTPVTALGSYSQPRVMPDLERDRFLRALAKRSDEKLYQSILQGRITQ